MPLVQMRATARVSFDRALHDAGCARPPVCRLTGPCTGLPDDVSRTASEALCVCWRAGLTAPLHQRQDLVYLSGTRCWHLDLVAYPHA